ncbi:MAG TPA: sigma-70 family RNA polymerase sigma factor [Bacteroidetes bacterium]|nr:sigma-70 family RNA polymerase sigma factor [Bacteroidota bacterium]
MNDNILISKIKGRPEDRVEALHHLYTADDCHVQKAVIAHVMKEGGDRESGLGICHEAFIIADRKIREGEFRGDSSISSFIIGIAKNLWRNKIKKKKPDFSLEGILEMCADDDLEAKYFKKERMELVLGVIGTLAEKCKEVLLHYNLGYTNEEIAGLLGHPNVKYTQNTLYRCLGKLKKMFTPKKMKK